VAGEPIDRLAGADHPQGQRDHVAHTLSRLAVREFFEMRLVQTDPNFGNYLFDAATGRIALLDFGATEAVTVERVEQLRAWGGRCAISMRRVSPPRHIEAGFVAAEDPPSQTRAVIDMMLTAGEPLAHRGPYDFGASDLFGRVFDLGRAQAMGEGYARTPPADLLFLQRKFVGTFMLCTRLKARVNLAEVFGDHL
jgi:aarF domain-containing kinase